MGAAFGFLLIIAAIVAFIAALFIFPSFLEGVVWTTIIIVAGIIILFAGIALVAMFLIIPMYVHKGVEYQTGISYDIDDVKPVKDEMEKKE